jgi:uncharacterized protein YrrD
MILLGSALIHLPIMGLQTGAELARLSTPIIDPANLSIVAYELDGPLLATRPTLLRIADVRELSDIGMIVDSSDEFVQPEDIVALQSLYKLRFKLIGMPVIDERRRKLGKVTDFTLDTTSFIVQQLNVKRPIFKSLSDTELLIHRSQIIEINNQAIVVHSEAKVPELERHEVIGSYVNPFRKSEPAADSAQPKE